KEWNGASAEARRAERGGPSTEPIPGPASRFALRALRSVSPARTFRWCWIAVYFVFFSLAGTKLPNYILPVYAPLAILTARFFERWRAGAIQPAAWALHVSIACLALIGFGTAVALLVAGGVIRLPTAHGVQLAGLASLAVLGALPVGGAAAAWFCLRRRQPSGLVVGATVSCV